MGTKILTALAVIAIASGPALAQPAPAPAAASNTASAASLFAAGYEVKVINDVSSDEQKAIWPNDPVNPYIMVTLQKGTSVAVCAMSMANWVSLNEATLASATLCKKN